MNKAENINLEPINLSILNVMQFIKNGCYIKILHCSLEKSILCSQFILNFEIKVKLITSMLLCQQLSFTTLSVIPNCQRQYETNFFPDILSCPLIITESLSYLYLFLYDQTSIFYFNVYKRSLGNLICIVIFIIDDMSFFLIYKCKNTWKYDVIVIVQRLYPVSQVQDLKSNSLCISQFNFFDLFIIELYRT